jgi:TolA-binding protein
MKMANSTVVLSCLALLCLAHCASTNRAIGDRLYGRQDYEKAAVFYERCLREDGHVEDEDEVMLRLGVSYYLSGEAASEAARRRYRDKALAVFGDLLDRFPRSSRRPQVIALVELDRMVVSRGQEIERLRLEIEEHERRGAELLTDTRGLSEDMAKLRSELEDRGVALEKLEKSREQHAQEVRRLQELADTQDKRIRRLVRELTELKRIDMQPSSGGGR